MNYVESTLLRNRGSHAGLLMVVALLIVFGFIATQNAQWLNAFSHVNDRSVFASASANTVAASPNHANYNALPIILTVPFAVTRTQQMMVMRLKRRQIATHIAKLPGIKGATGLIAGLALIQAVQSSSSR